MSCSIVDGMVARGSHCQRSCRNNAITRGRAVSVLFLSSACDLVVLLLCLCFALRALIWTLRLPANPKTLVKGRLQLLYDRDTRRTILSASHHTGPGFCVHHNSAAVPRFEFACDCNSMSEHCHRGRHLDTRSRARASHDSQRACACCHAECKTMLDIS